MGTKYNFFVESDFVIRCYEAIFNKMEVNSIQFGILSDDDIVHMSACVVNKTSLTAEYGSVYDPRMGCVQNGEICATCGEDLWSCSGHFGMIELNTPIVIFHKQVVTLLRCVCLDCCRLLAIPSPKLKSFDRIVDFLHNISSCPYCETQVPDIKFVAADATITVTRKNKVTKTKVTSEIQPPQIKRIFDALPEEDVAMLMVDTSMVHPKNYVLTKFPVVPTCCRPKMNAGDSVSDDDLTLMLVDIIKANNYIADHAPTDDPIAYAKAVDMIKIRTLSYCNNSRGRSIHTTNHRPLTGIADRLNGKKAMMRQSLTGKRCDRTIRTVLGPDPTLKLDQVAIPEEIANVITIPEYVTPLNIDRLTNLVNKGRASTIIKQNGTKINVAYARISRGTKLTHTDTVIRKDVGDIPVLDCKMRLYETDLVKHQNGTIEPVKLPVTKQLTLTPGDKVERYLKDGDPVYLNRQPTLHRNGMLGMRAVIKPGRTLRFNLAINKGLNADFDGDEGNIFCCESQGAHAELLNIVNVKDHMLSAQTNKPEQCLVQDSLLAAYLMTCKPQPMDRDDFMYCLARTNKSHLFKPAKSYDARDLFTYILPADFNAVYPKMKIVRGKVVEGYFDKTSLGTTTNSIIRLLHIDHGKEVAAEFIDNIQFLAHAWLEGHPFSIGIDDCLITEQKKVEEIKEIVQKYFIEASVASRTVSSANVREAKISMALNKAKDLGLKIAKDALSSDNKIKDTVISGSKGDFFNIAQTTGLLGQQNLHNARPAPTLTNRKRTMIHYPHVIIDNDQKYESRGFVQSSFIGGLNPKEMWFHAMTGREGMINTAMETARSGYIQRSFIKIAEDLKVAYDGTVRDAKGGLHQFSYNMGYEPSLVSFKNNIPVPVEFDRLTERLNCTGKEDIRNLTQEEVENIIQQCEPKTMKANIPHEIYESIWGKQERILRRELECACIAADKYQEFERIVTEKYSTALIAPGESVGIIGAQSIGEKQTQTTLNTFHTAGKLQYNGVERFEEILKMTKSLRMPMMSIYLNKKYDNAEELRNEIGCSIVGLTLDDVTQRIEKLCENSWRLHLKKSKLFSVRLSPDQICDVVTSTFDTVDIDLDSSLTLVVSINQREKKKRKEQSDSQITGSTISSAKKETTIKQVMDTLVCGIEGIKAMHLDMDDNNELYILTEGSNYKKMLCHPQVDIKRLYTNDIWSVYNCVGIAATRRMLLEDIKRCVVGVNDCHPRLLVDKMTYTGTPCSITRYTMKINAVGPLSKATFEQTVEILTNAAFRGEIDTLSGVSACIVAGKQIRAGTGAIDCLVDWKAIEGERSEDVCYY